MVESIYVLKPAWCGAHFAGLWPEQGFQPVTRATALRRWFVTPVIRCPVGVDLVEQFPEEVTVNRVVDAVFIEAGLVGDFVSVGILLLMATFNAIFQCF